VELEHVLSGGEDYALVVSASMEIPGFRVIGSVEEGAGVVLRDRAGRAHPLEAGGFDHFASPGGTVP
jgi:thiamine monophosphate kinase